MSQCQRRRSNGGQPHNSLAMFKQARITEAPPNVHTDTIGEKQRRPRTVAQSVPISRSVSHLGTRLCFATRATPKRPCIAQGNEPRCQYGIHESGQCSRVREILGAVARRSNSCVVCQQPPKADPGSVPGDRQRFTVAHETGHLGLHTGLGPPETVEEANRVEKQTHHFAGALSSPGRRTHARSPR